jgi:hypothetical protein
MKPKIKKHNNMERKETYKVPEVLSFVSMPGLNNPLTRNYDGDIIKMGSLRYQTFIKSGIKCVTCGLEASFFAKERTVGQKKYHFNLYGVDSEGDELLFTKDHIYPKSLGGQDILSNFQTMCIVCNSEKSNKV